MRRSARPAWRTEGRPGGRWGPPTSANAPPRTRRPAGAGRPTRAGRSPRDPARRGRARRRPAPEASPDGTRVTRGRLTRASCLTNTLPDAVQHERSEAPVDPAIGLGAPGADQPDRGRTAPGGDAPALRARAGRGARRLAGDAPGGAPRARRRGPAAPDVGLGNVRGRV